jgi:hypothetical protein
VRRPPIPINRVFCGIGCLYATANTDAGLTTATLITAGAVPADLINGAGLLAPFPGGATTIVPTTDNLGFIVSHGGMPKPPNDSFDGC